MQTSHAEAEDWKNCDNAFTASASSGYLLSLTKAEGDDPEKTFRIDASLTGDYADGALKDIDMAYKQCGCMCGEIFLQLQ
jgi:hypothetical protein